MSDEPNTAISAAAPGDERRAAGLRGFGPLGILAMIVIFAGNLLFAPLTALLVLLWAKQSRTPWHEIGYVRPKSWLADLAIGCIFGIAFKLTMKAVVMPLLIADPINHAYHYIAGNPAALAYALVAVVVAAGFGEETFFRGYLFERAGKLIGRSIRARAVTVLLTSLFFASLHYPDQGLGGAEQAFITGAVFGAIYARTGHLYMLMCAHAAFDVAAVIIIYFDIESKIAHLVFR